MMLADEAEKYDHKKRFEVRIRSDLVPGFEQKCFRADVSFNEAINVLVRLLVEGEVVIEGRKVSAQVVRGKSPA